MSPVTKKKKPWINKKNKKKRFNFAKSLSDWDAEDFQKVLWSDESIIKFGYDNNGNFIWKLKGK